MWQFDPVPLESALLAYVVTMNGLNVLTDMGVSECLCREEFCLGQNNDFMLIYVNC